MFSRLRYPGVIHTYIHIHITMINIVSGFPDSDGLRAMRAKEYELAQFRESIQQASGGG